MKKLQSKKKRTVSSRAWLLRQINDPYVEQAARDGYRSRAAYKLIQMQEKFKFIGPNHTVVDLGAAPGGWMQVARQFTKGVVVGMDLQMIDPIPDTLFFQGDFFENAHILKDHLPGGKANVILSDMAASACGVSKVDHIRIMNLLEAALDFAQDHLAPSGTLVGKVLQGGTENTLLIRLKKMFNKVCHFKPDASRSGSSELYVVAIGFRG